MRMDAQTAARIRDNFIKKDAWNKVEKACHQCAEIDALGHAKSKLSHKRVAKNHKTGATNQAPESQTKHTKLAKDYVQILDKSVKIGRLSLSKDHVNMPTVKKMYEGDMGHPGPQNRRTLCDDSCLHLGASIL